MFAAVDANGDGIVDFPEMFSCLVGGSLSEGKFPICVWTQADYGTNKTEIDEDHMELFNLINTLTSATRTGDVANVKRAVAAVDEVDLQTITLPPNHGQE